MEALRLKIIEIAIMIEFDCDFDNDFDNDFDLDTFDFTVAREVTQKTVGKVLLTITFL